MTTSLAIHLRRALRIGLISGAVIVLLGLVGILEAFNQRAIVSGWASLSQVLAYAVVFGGAFVVSRGSPHSTTPGGRDELLRSALAAATVAVVAAAVVNIVTTVGPMVNMRAMFINASPALFHILSATTWLFVPVALLATLVARLAPQVRRALGVGLVTVLIIGLLGDQLILILQHNRITPKSVGWLLAAKGLTPQGALMVFAVAALLNGYWSTRGAAVRLAYERQPPARRRALRTGGLALLAVGVIILPQLLGVYHSEVLNQVGLFILMGLGLNIVVGFAGMLDLGYVAFFAIGAYTVAVLTSPESFLVRGMGGHHSAMSYWLALPIALVVAVAAGVILGIPVLKMRGDYLAIVTLGFGEIIRLLALSDWLAPYLGGAQGIAGIPPITIPLIGFSVSGPDKPQKLFYVILVACLIAAYVATRLKDSRMGRAWMAIREDEDVAEAMGLNLVQNKLMAFAIGAAFSGLAGTLFAPKLLSIYPHSFGLLISINILALIIVGGMGNIAGVVVGALVLVGLPELLREFAEYRLLVYGAVLVAMMLYKPEGLLPSTIVKREMREMHEAGAAIPPGAKSAAPVDTGTAA